MEKFRTLHCSFHFYIPFTYYDSIELWTSFITTGTIQISIELCLAQLSYIVVQLEVFLKFKQIGALKGMRASWKKRYEIKKR